MTFDTVIQVIRFSNYHDVVLRRSYLQRLLNFS